MERLLTVEETSELIRLKPATLYAYTCARKIPFLKVGTRVLFESEVLEKWVKERRVKMIDVAN